VGHRHVLAARRQHRRDPQGELPQRARRRGDEGGAGADRLGPPVSPSAARSGKRGDQLEENRAPFERSLAIERGNVTLPGEQASADALALLSQRYFQQVDAFFAIPPERKEERTRLYFNRLLPTFKDIKREADAVLAMNQQNMEDQNARARAAASGSIRLMVLGRCWCRLRSPR